MIPFAAWRTEHVIYHVVRPHSPAIVAKQPARARTGAKVPWVVWIGFNEMDQPAAFEDANNASLLPARYAFRDTAFYATQAYQPAHYTARSIPAYLTGLLP